MRGALIVTAMAAVLVSGCGRSDTDSDADAARSAARTYLTALSHRDYVGACRQLAASAQRDIATYVGGALPELGTTRCTSVIRQALEMADGQRLAALGDMKITRVTVAGDTASVQLAGRGQPVKLAKDRGGWKIATLEFSVASSG